MNHYPQYDIQWTRNAQGEVVQAPTQIDPREFQIDLRWSLWCQHWEEIAEGGRGKITVAAMVDAFNGLGEVTVFTAPKKEIRFGKVVIDGHKAWVDFSFEWDEGYEQLWRVEELTGELSEEEYELAREEVDVFLMELENHEDRELESDTFEGLLAAIDEVESDLLESEDRQSKEFEEHLKNVAECIKERRAARA